MAGPVAAGWTGPTSPAARPRYGSDRLLEKPLYYVPLALLMATSGFVMFEPAPYDVFSIGVMLLFLIGGMILTPGIAPLLTLLMMFFASGFVAATQTVSTDGSYFYIVVTTFLGLNAVFFAFVVAMNPVRAFNVIMAGYVVAGLFTAIAAIGGYFGAIPFSDSFLLYGRAKGTFQDPNVMGPFLIPPTLFLLSRIIRSRVMFRLPELGVLLVLVAAIFLSFSRGA
ncbi:MAG: hypothetical protein KDJ77_07700, partial [Rhodobiaceae bacterium]|nr:hypothetical protein [Rhodobiaceae bacterium]